MLEVFKRVSVWNNARYEQTYNRDLAMQLLREEYAEWLAKDGLVNEVKELSDIIFVAMGVIWKLDVSDEDNQTWADHSGQYVANLLQLSNLAPAYYVGSLLDMMEDAHLSPLNVCHVIIYLCLAQLSYIGLSDECTTDCINAVCNSNDSKAVKKTASGIKANLDKGESYKKADTDLLIILSKEGLTECLSLVH